MLRLTLFLGLVCCACTVELSVRVSENCGDTYSVDYKNLKLIYSGERLTTDCRFTITGGIGKDICSKPEKFSLSCGNTVEYRKYYYQSSLTDDSYSCYSEQSSDYCSDASDLIVVFRQSGSSAGNDDVVLILYERDNEFAKKIVDTVATTVYVIIGVVVGVIVLVIIATIIVIICCCRRRSQRSPGNVYTAQPDSYPMQNQQPYGYQPNQGFGGYPPNSQGNFQAPAQGGYPPTSQAGMYPPTSQAGYEPPPEYKETGNQQN